MSPVHQTNEDRESVVARDKHDNSRLAALGFQQDNGVRDAGFVRSVGHETSLFFLAEIGHVNARECSQRAFSEVF